MKISYIIVSYKSELLLEDCMQSIRQFDGEYEIIVVDNSPLENQKVIENMCKHFDESIIYIPNQNLGYGQGNNVGIKRASGDIICVINPDVRFVEPYVENVKSYFSADEKNALIGFKQIGGYDLSFYLKPEYDLPFIFSFIVKAFNKLEIYNSNYFFLSGACFFVSKTKFEKIGLFDENFFLYYEEADINKRFLKHGYKMNYSKAVKYVHLVGNRESVSIPAFKFEMKSLYYYIDKYKLNKSYRFFLKKIEFYLTSKAKYNVLKEVFSNKKEVN